jgi:hypothetical protein
MGAYSNVSGSKSEGFYPIAENVPFTPVIRGAPGDPLYVDPTLPRDMASASQVPMDQFVKILQSTSAKSREDVDPTTGVMLLLGAMTLPIAAMAGVKPPEGTEHYLLAALVMMLIAKTLLLEPVTNAIAKTVELWKNRPVGPTPSCEMKFTDEAIEKIKQTHQFPSELKDVLSFDKIEDPVTFLDRTGTDKTMTIFERSTAEQLLQNGFLHPITKRPLNRADLVELPELKRQIEDLSQDPDITMP